ncbi:unnamed protein product [Rhizophagus irregularis]|nr:unnamed protein product [Rhizophagus irregularis]CAB4438323.1 unnamed protein product [Rhizophagus irregularis]
MMACKQTATKKLGPTKRNCFWGNLLWAHGIYSTHYMGDITKLARNEVDDLNYHFLQYCKCSVTTAKKLKSVASMDINIYINLPHGPHLYENLSRNDRSPFGDTAYGKGSRKRVPDFHIEGKGSRNEFRTPYRRSYDFEVFPAYLDVNTMDALVSLAGNANKNYNPDRTAYLGIPLWGSLAQAACTIAHIEVKEAERQVGLPYRRFSYRRYKKPKGSVMFTNVSAFSFVCPRLSGRFVGSISRVQDAEGTGLNFEGPGRRRT